MNLYKMNKLYLLLALVGFGLTMQAQQEEHFSQFMYHKMGLNPAYAGNNDGACITALTRNQWLGLDGAPETQLISFNTPMWGKRLGVGATMHRQTIGVSEMLTAESAYAYRPNLGPGTLSIGIMASVRFLRINYSQTEAIQSKDIDTAIPADLQSKFVPNFGAGIYYSSKRFYLGFSVPRLLENNIDLADGDVTISKEVRHIYTMAGLLFDWGDDLQVQPQVLLKYVSGTPFDGDVNVNFIYKNIVTAGLGYRLGGSISSGIGESAIVLLGAQVTSSLLLGISYDATLSQLRSYNSGSIEAVVRYCIGGQSEGESFVSPRFF